MPPKSEKNFPTIKTPPPVETAVDTRISINETRTAFIDYLKKNNVISALMIHRLIPSHLNPEFLASNEVQTAIQTAFLYCLREGVIEVALKIYQTFPLAPEQIQSATETAFLERLKKDDLHNAISIHQTFPLASEFLTSEVVQSFIQTAFLLERLKKNYIERALSIHRIFPLTPKFLASEEVQSFIQTAFLDSLADGNIHNALKIFKDLPLAHEFLASDDVQSVVQTAYLACMEVGDISDALTIFKSFPLSPEFLASKEVRSAFKKYLPGLNLNLNEVFDIINKDRFGINLFSHFQRFDKTAKEAVSTILSLDNTIPEEVDRRGIEYRLLVQDKLKTFKNNTAIINRLDQKGINTENWLEYPETRYFTLGKAEDLSLNERILNPVNRIPEALDRYKKVVINSITEYKKELVDKTIPEDLTELSDNLKRLETNLTIVTDPEKRRKMEQGAQNLHERLDNPRKLRVWDRLRSELDKLVKLSQEIKRVNEKQIETNKTKIAVVDDTTMEEARRLKAENWERQKTIISGLQTLKHRLDNLLSLIEKTLEPILGEERTTGLIQQITSEIGEHQDHLQTDFSTVLDFIKTETEPTETIPDGEVDAETVPDEEVVDDDVYRYNPAHAKMLSGRQMSIRIGTRCRQDLYIGNYTTCCIRIDSNYHNEESPIADYVTDLGMHNVLLCDETTKTPVACAWCWLGIDKESGETALVIDNIEGWQKYTVNFQTQLKGELRTYLQKMAKSINVSTLSQGPDYNDIDVLDKDLQIERFVKLGGYNRVDGYYLEAEVGGNDNGEVDDEDDIFFDDYED